MGYVSAQPSIFAHRLFHAQEIYPVTVPGGVPAPGKNIRNINTILTNEIGATLASKQITIPAGNYYVEAAAPGCGLAENILRIYDVTNQAYITELDGFIVYSYYMYYACNVAHCSGRLTVTGQTTIELQHIVTDNNGAGVNGLGHPMQSSIGTVVIDHDAYADIKLWKLT